MTRGAKLAYVLHYRHMQVQCPAGMGTVADVSAVRQFFSLLWSRLQRDGWDVLPRLSKP